MQAANGHAALPVHGDEHLPGVGSAVGAGGGVVDDHGRGAGEAGGGDKPYVVQVLHAVLPAQLNGAAVVAGVGIVGIEGALPLRGLGEGDVVQPGARLLTANLVELQAIELDGGVV